MLGVTRDRNTTAYEYNYNSMNNIKTAIICIAVYECHYTSDSSNPYIQFARHRGEREWYIVYTAGVMAHVQWIQMISSAMLVAMGLHGFPWASTGLCESSLVSMNLHESP